MPAEKISLERAKSDKLFYFVASVVVYRETDGRCLILKRSEREIAHPGKWGVVGGKLEWNQLDINHPTRVNGDVLDFENAIGGLLKREAREEADIEIDEVLHYIDNVAFVRPDGIPVVLVKFATRFIGGEARPEAGSFDECVWVNEQEVKEYVCIDGIADEVSRTIKLFKNK